MIVEHFECQCSSDEHTLKFVLEEVTDINYLEIYTSVFLNQFNPWWKRLWIAIKYVFGYKSKYGHWDCFLMRPADVGRMMLLLKKFKDLESKLKNP